MAELEAKVRNVAEAEKPDEDAVTLLPAEPPEELRWRYVTGVLGVSGLLTALTLLLVRDPSPRAESAATAGAPTSLPSSRKIRRTAKNTSRRPKAADARAAASCWKARAPKPSRSERAARYSRISVRDAAPRRSG